MILSFAYDTLTHDGHGIVAKSKGLLPPNHYLSVAIFHLFQHRPGWRKEASVGKTVVSSQMIDRVTAKLDWARWSGFGLKWLSDGCLTVPATGSRSRGRYLRPSRWHGLDDRQRWNYPALLAESPRKRATIPGNLTNFAMTFGEPFATGLEAPATPDQETIGETPRRSRSSPPVGGAKDCNLSNRPGNGAPIGEFKVMAENGWICQRPSGGRISKSYARKLPQGGSSAASWRNRSSAMRWR